MCPRPPAFTAKTRAEVAEMAKIVDNYTPQPAWAGQTRAPKPARIAAYEVETVAEGLASPWSFSFLPDGRMLVSETSRGLRIVEKNGRLGEHISGLPIDFSQTCAATARFNSRQGFCPKPRHLFSLSRPSSMKREISERVRKIFRCTIPRSRWSGEGGSRPTTSV